MKTVKFMIRGLGIAATTFLAGCFSSPVTFVSSTVPTAQGKYSVLADEVTGTSTQVQWLFFSFGMGGSGQRNAYRDALRQVPGCDGLISAAVDEECFILFPVVLPSFYTTRIAGTPVKLSRND